MFDTKSYSNLFGLLKVRKLFRGSWSAFLGQTLSRGSSSGNGEFPFATVDGFDFFGQYTNVSIYKKCVYKKNS